MKLTLVLLVTALVHVSAASVSQTVTFSGKNVSLETVFTAVKKQTGYVIWGNSDVLKTAKPVSLDVQNMPLTAFLDLAMREQFLNYKIAEKNIILSRKSVAAEESEAAILPVPQSITGTVLDSLSKPIEGASIMLRPGNKGASTDANGAFVISNVVPGNYMITISFLGFQPITRPVVVSPTTVLTMGSIVLRRSAAALEDVVIGNGLFSRPRESFTGAVASFTGKELKRVGNINVLQSLAILDPSFVIVDNLETGSDPNKLPEIIMRGASGVPDLSLNAQYSNLPNLPLFILDGFETTVQKVYDLNMNMVASITLLKDASAKAVYGSKAGNGVVVIETLRPTAGNLRLSYTGSLDITAPDLTSYHMTNSVQKIQAEALAGKYSSDYPEIQFDLTKQYTANLQQAMGGINTYWLSQPLQNGVGQKHNIYLDGGSEAMRYSVGVNYNNLTGVMKGSDRTTVSGLVNLSYRKKNFSFRNNLSIDVNKGVNSPYGDFATYAKLNPYWRIYDDNGKLIPSYTILSTKVFNPLYDASLNTKDNSKYTNITENFYGEWEAMKNLRFTARVGISAQNNNTEYFLPSTHTKFINVPTTSPEYLNRGEYTITNGKMNNVSSDIGAAYSFQSGKSQLFANLLYSIQQSSTSGNGMTMVGFPNDKLDDISLGRQYQTGSKATGTENTSRNIGITSAVNYSYDNRFLADISLRESASSQFGSDKRWGTFWSTGLGWNLHHENFMRAFKYINLLKIRGSVGSSGTQNFSSYQSITSYNYVTDITYNGDLGLRLLALSNPNLRWQQVMDQNIGIDATIFNRINLRFDYYIKDTKDLLSDQTVAPSAGFASYKENVGETRNKGFQANISSRVYNNNAKRIYVTVFANVAHNTNRIRKVSDALTYLNKRQDSVLVGGILNAPATSKPVTRFAENQSMSAIWAVRSLGIDPANGKEIFVKRDGTHTYIWSANDQVVVGDAIAKYNGSFGSNVQYKGLSLNFAFGYRLGGQAYNSTLVDKVENADINYNVDVRLLEGRWKTPGQLTLYKDIKDGSVTKPTSRFVQDLNELIFSSVNVGYELSKLRFVRKMKMNSLTATFNANELGRISSVKTERGLGYPFARTFSFSLQANF